MSMGLPLELAAKQMGHSMTIHSQVYHRWICDLQHEKAYKEIFQYLVIGLISEISKQNHNSAI